MTSKLRQQRSEWKQIMKKKKKDKILSIWYYHLFTSFPDKCFISLDQSCCKVGIFPSWSRNLEGGK